MRVLRKVFGFLASIKLAVFTLLGLVGALTAATFIESAYDTPTAQYYVYRSGVFALFLGFLGVNITCSALSRLPWKRRHTAFLLAHAGIITLLVGSLITSEMGIDGMLRIVEGTRAAQVEISDDLSLLIQDPARGSAVKRVPIRWLPPGVSFRPFSLPEWDLRVEEFLSHADLDMSFVPSPKEDAAAAKVATAAVKLVLQGGPMQVRQEYWLWQGDPGWGQVQAGPAWLTLAGGAKRAQSPVPTGTRVKLELSVAGGKASNRSVRWRATASDGKVREGSARPGQAIDPGWKQVKIQLLEMIPFAEARTNYTNSRIQYGSAAPPSAVRVATGSGAEQTSAWLGLGDRAVLRTQGREVVIGYFPKRVVLPFEVELDRFTIQRYEGSQDPASFSSRVQVHTAGGGRREQEISMNEPLHEGGFTVYQSSYEDAQPRPTVSIFSVNRDPGRALKYLGSALIVLGTIWLFASRFGKKKTAPSLSH